MRQPAPWRGGGRWGVACHGDMGRRMEGARQGQPVPAHGVCARHRGSSPTGAAKTVLSIIYCVFRAFPSDHQRFFGRFRPNRPDRAPGTGGHDQRISLPGNTLPPCDNFPVCLDKGFALANTMGNRAAVRGNARPLPRLLDKQGCIRLISCHFPDDLSGGDGCGTHPSRSPHAQVHRPPHCPVGAGPCRL